MGGCRIFLFKRFGYGSLCNVFIFLLENLSCLQFFCDFSGSGPPEYRFLIIHSVDCYVFIFENVCTVCFYVPLEVVAGLFSWSPSEVGTWYLSGAACLCMRGAIVVLFWMGFIVPFVNIAHMASMAANYKLQILSGTSLSADVKKIMACVILSSPVICGCVRYI